MKGRIKLYIKFIVIIFMTFLFVGKAYSQGDSCKVIQVIMKSYSDTSALNTFYQKKGIFLVQNGIYDFKIKGKNYFKYRIFDIKGDTISLAWATENTPLKKITVDEIDKVVFPSLNNGVTGFPNPTMSRKKYSFKITCRIPYKHTISKLCENDDCSIYKEAYLYMTSGYGWKPIYEIDGKTYMLDRYVIHELKKE